MRMRPAAARPSCSPIKATTAVMALAGLYVGRAAVGFIRIRPDVLTGAALVVMATVMGPHQ